MEKIWVEKEYVREVSAICRSYNRILLIPAYLVPFVVGSASRSHCYRMRDVGKDLEQHLESRISLT